MRVLTVLFFFVILIGCSKSKSPDLLQDNSVWVFASEKFSNPGELQTMELRFRENGYAYEENTILTYPYSYNKYLKIFEINNQVYEILESTQTKLIMKNKDTGIKVLLYSK